MATMESRRLRSGSLSSGSDSESDIEDSRRSRLKSSVQRVGTARLKPSSASPSVSDDHSRPHSLHSSRSPPTQKRRRRVTPSPPPRRRRRDTPPRSRGESPDRRRGRHRSPTSQSSSESDGTPSPKRKREEPDPLLTRTGGAYIPPAKLRMMQKNISDKSSVAYQRISWEALKKSINGLINKVNVSNIDKIVPELFEENVVRGRGLLTRCIIQAQAASPVFSHVYAALVSVINTKFPQTGELICKRLILQFRRGFKRNDKTICMTAVKFLAHLVNQQVLHEIAALELLTLLMEEPTDDSVEVAVGFIKECGLKLTEVSPRGALAMFETLRSVLHSGKISSRIQYMIEVLFAIRKDKFKDHPSVIEGLDLVEEDDQITHLLSLADEFDGQEELNVFHPDPDFLTNEEKYRVIKAEILGGESGSEGSGSGSDEEESSEEEEEEEEAKMEIEDMTDAKLLTLRRNIYLTIMSSANFEECVHKLVKNLQEGTEGEIANMVVECCSQERSYLRFYGHMAQRLCQLGQAWVAVFDEAYQQQYATVHRLETNKLRNTARLFAQLFYSDALPWTALSCVHLNEEETTSSSRIFVKILFQELAEFMGMSRLNERLRDPLLAVAFEGLLPRDNPKNTRFAINFFTSIGLGGLTDDLREHLKNTQKMIMEQKQEVSSSDTSSSEEDSSSEESSEESTEESSSSSSEEERRRSRRKHHSHKKHHSRRNRSRSESEEERGKERKKERSERKHRNDRREESEREQRKKRSESREEPERQQKRRSENREEPERQRRRKRSDEPEQLKRREGHRGKRERRDEELSDSDKRSHGHVRRKGSADRETRSDHRHRDDSPVRRRGSPARGQRSPGRSGRSGRDRDYGDRHRR